MTKLLDKAMMAAQTLSPEAQDEVARVVLAMATGEDFVYELSPHEAASLAESRAQSRRSEYATNEEVQAVWEKHGL